jgi:hypothetical protein
VGSAEFLSPVSDRPRPAHRASPTIVREARLTNRGVHGVDALASGPKRFGRIRYPCAIPSGLRPHTTHRALVLAEPAHPW